jgi:Domain of unknown function (DUF4157)
MRERSQTQTKTTPKTSFTPVKTGLLQRKCACGNSAGLTGKCTECQNKQLTLQRRSNNQAEPDEVPPIVHEVLRSPGSLLNSNTFISKGLHFSQDFSRIPIHEIARQKLQTQLKIGEPGDKYEQEADRVADMVMRMPELEKTEDTVLQAKSVTDRPLQTTLGLGTQISALQSNGQPLDPATRAFMEPRLGYDLSPVRLHTDSQATEMAQALNAKAFTVGRDIVFAAGQYQPGTRTGQHLLAHELTHFIQQRGRQRLGTTIQKMSDRLPIDYLHLSQDILQASPNTCTYGEIRSWAITSQSDFSAPGGLANAKASIGAVCSRNPCSCVDGSTATAPGDRAAWRNIVAARGGSDRSGGGNYMCVGSNRCRFVHSCYSCVTENGTQRRSLTRRASPLSTSGTTTVTGKGTLYFYNDPLSGWCNREDYRSGCQGTSGATESTTGAVTEAVESVTGALATAVGSTIEAVTSIFNFFD